MKHIKKFEMLNTAPTNLKINESPVLIYPYITEGIFADDPHFMEPYSDEIEKINKLRSQPFSEDNYKKLLDYLSGSLRSIPVEIKSTKDKIWTRQEISDLITKLVKHELEMLKYKKQTPWD